MTIHITQLSFSDILAIVGIIVTIVGIIVAIVPSWRSNIIIAGYKFLSEWSNERGREISLTWQLMQQIRCLFKHWKKYIFYNGVKDKHIQSIRKAIARTYFPEEVKDISGKADRASKHREKGSSEEKVEGCQGTEILEEDRPLLVSNFVNYARMVNAIIDESRKEYPPKEEYTIFCFTTLSASLFQWFNFEGGYYTRKGWDDYLEDLFGFSKDKNIVLSRCLLLRPEGDAPEGFERSIKKVERNEKLDGLEIHEKRTVEVLREEVNSWIWLPQIQGDYRFCYLLKNETAVGAAGLALPRFRDSILERCGFSNNNICEFLREKYSSAQPAYWILPEGLLLNSEWNNEYGRFDRLGRQFCDRYHTKGNDGAFNFSFYSVVEKWEETFKDGYATDGSINEPRLPNDFFYIAAIKGKAAGERLREAESGTEVAGILRNNSEDIFCLGGSMDDNLRTIHLHLLDPYRTPIYFGRIKNFIFELLEGTGSVSESGNVSDLIEDSSPVSSSR
uniref:Uncharacterized protein n=1 Tax=Candidatus Kentrum sp. DK TaxID=2126562 RepID=A0A450S7V3_9GAMM|nr:MAG: hypothetical protein BECKDK2373B_GA0170837_101925 [Candidatus Kentron sp. DK]